MTWKSSRPTLPPTAVRPSACLQDLQTRNERMFLVTILIMNTAASRQKLENAIFQTASIAQKYNCALKRLDFQQEEGLMSSLPIGLNQIEIERGLTTSSTAGVRPVHDAGAFSGRRGAVLRAECALQQHDHG